MKIGDRFLLVQADEVVHASVEDDVITVVTNSLSGTSNYRTLDELQARLDPAVFWRVHRSHLVNINKIKEIVPWFSRNYLLKMKDAKGHRNPRQPLADEAASRVSEAMSHPRFSRFPSGSRRSGPAADARAARPAEPLPFSAAPPSRRRSSQTSSPRPLEPEAAPPVEPSWRQILATRPADDRAEARGRGDAGDPIDTTIGTLGTSRWAARPAKTASSNRRPPEPAAELRTPCRCARRSGRSRRSRAGSAKSSSPG